MKTLVYMANRMKRQVWTWMIRVLLVPVRQELAGLALKLHFNSIV